MANAAEDDDDDGDDIDEIAKCEKEKENSFKLDLIRKRYRKI